MHLIDTAVTIGLSPQRIKKEEQSMESITISWDGGGGGVKWVRGSLEPSITSMNKMVVIKTHAALCTTYPILPYLLQLTLTFHCLQIDCVVHQHRFIKTL